MWLKMSRSWLLPKESKMQRALQPLSCQLHLIAMFTANMPWQQEDERRLVEFGLFEVWNLGIIQTKNIININKSNKVEHNVCTILCLYICFFVLPFMSMPVFDRTRAITMIMLEVTCFQRSQMIQEPGLTKSLRNAWQSMMWTSVALFWYELSFWFSGLAYCKVYSYKTYKMFGTLSNQWYLALL